MAEISEKGCCQRKVKSYSSILVISKSNLKFRTKVKMTDKNDKEEEGGLYMIERKILQRWSP